jgi:hypothetical protein
MLLDVAVGLFRQAASLVMVQLTTSPSARVLLVKVLVFIPTVFPFTIHRYEGEPPADVEVVVNWIVIPAQMAVVDALMFIVGVATAVSDIGMLLEAAERLVKQPALLVRRQLTTSPLAGVLSRKTMVFVPVLFPFTCHW